MYYSLNGDSVGSKIGEMASQDNEQGLSDLSSQFKNAHAMIDQWVQSMGGRVISSSGDENLFFLENPEGLEQLLSDYSEHTGNTATVGCGDTISSAVKAMIYGKGNAPGSITQYSPEIDASLNGEGQQENPEENQQEQLNDSSVPPEQDPTNQLPANDPANPDIEGNGVTEDGGPQVGGPIDQENGVDPVSPLPMDQEQNIPEQKQAAPQSVIPQENSAQSQKQPAQNPFGAKQAQPVGNATSIPAIVPNKDSAPVVAPQPPQNSQNQDVLPTQKAPEANNLPTNNPQASEKTIEMPVGELVDEHEELVNTLESPSHEDDKQEAVEQGQELEEYKAVQNEDGKENGQEGELTGVMDSQIDGEQDSSENEQDGIGQIPENNENANNEEMNAESEDGVDIESLRNEIAQNLLTFKENKQFFEESKQTNPKLYLATISLLRNMIQMAKELGLTPGNDMDQMSGNLPESNDNQPESNSSFPPKKDNAQNAPKEGSNAPIAQKKDSGFPPKKEDNKEEPKKEEKKPPFGKK